MTPKQKTLYWREWGAVRKAMPDADRHELHIRALGYDKSSKDFGNSDLDKVLGVFRAISRPDDLNGQIRQLNQAKTRLIYRVRKMAPEAYRDAIMQDRFGTTNLWQLDESQLTQLRNTLQARVNGLRKLRKQPNQREAAMAAGIECPW